jgi:DNA-binding transcriptional MerR regulator
MTPDGEQWLGPGDTARRFGVTAKALRVYEREGLLKPARTAAGWRLYGPGDFARLHLIAVLRDLGLPLKAVRSLLGRKTPNLVALLTAQQEALEAKRGRIDQAIGLLTAALSDLAAGRALSLDDLTHLSRETVMSEDLSEAEARIRTLFDAHVGAETRAELSGRMRERIRTMGKSKEDMLQEFRILMAEGRKAMVVGDPDAEAAKAVVRRLNAQFGGAVSRDDLRRPRLRKVAQAILKIPFVASKLHADAQVIGFLETVGDGMRARGEIA